MCFRTVAVRLTLLLFTLTAATIDLIAPTPREVNNAVLNGGCPNATDLCTITTLMRGLSLLGPLVHVLPAKRAMAGCQKNR